MSSTQTLLKATLNRLAARLSTKLIYSVAEIAAIAKDAPEKLRQEWELFTEEVMTEADRLHKEEEKGMDPSTNQSETASEDPQTKIDQIRAKAAEINRKLEDKI